MNRTALRRAMVGVIFVFALILFSGFPGGDQVAHAQLDIDITKTKGGLVPCNGVNCNACDFVALGNNILEFLVTIGVALAVIAFAVGGFYMLSSGGNPGKVTKGKEIFTNVVIGLIILLAAWLIVDTVMKMLVDDQKLGPWNDVVCTLSSAGSSGGGGDGGDGSAETSPVPPSPPIEGTPVDQTFASHDEAISFLENNNIGFTSSNGADGVQSDCFGIGCTSFEGIRFNTLAGVVSVKNNCRCDIIITGATEGGVHADGPTSHENGFKVDLSNNQKLLDYIKTQDFVGTRSDGAALYKMKNIDKDIEFALENTHVDMTVNE